MNDIKLSGRISKDVTINGKTATGSIAVSRPYPFNKDQNGNNITDFHLIRFIGEKNAQRAAQYLTKGTAVIINGIACADSHKDESGNYKNFNYVLVKDWEFQQGKAENNGGNYSVPEESVQQPQAQPTQQAAPAPQNDFISIPEGIENELPFK